LTTAPARPIDAVRAMLAELIGGPDASIEHRRAQTEVFLQNQPPLPEGLRVSHFGLGGVPVEQISAAGRPTRGVFLHLHGGGYVMGAPAGSRALTAAIAARAPLAVVSLDYRLAPEHRLPAAVEDALGAYRSLLARGAAPGQIVIGGESAGGGLAIAALIAARDAGLPMPAGAVALSPWADLACEGDAYEAMRGRDPLLTREVLLEMARDYLGGGEAAHPWASPALADLTGLPPLLIQVGAEEVLLGDARRLDERARDCGVETALEVWPDMIHVWQMFAAMLPEAGAAIDRIVAFAMDRIAPGRLGAWTDPSSTP
jgi:monoterpene epsilon-lactone hydrolase